MGYKCHICGMNEVAHPGDVCDICALGEDPYLSELGGNMTQEQPGASYGASRNRRKMVPVQEKEETAYIPRQSRGRRVLVGNQPSIVQEQGGTDVQEQPQNQVHVYRPGQAPVHTPGISGQSAGSGGSQSTSAATLYVTKGIIKNVASDHEQHPLLLKVFRCLFFGVPLTINDDITTFQVFPDYTGQSVNAMGNACDQVNIYGKVNTGVVSENNEVEVYGTRDRHNVIVASKIKNVASGSIVTAYGAITPAVVWAVSAIILLAVGAVALALGAKGIIWLIVIVICLLNLPLILKIFALILGIIFSISRRN